MFIVPMKGITPLAGIEESPKLQSNTQAVPASQMATMPFKDILSQAFNEANSAVAVAEQNALDLALGKDIDPHILTINSARATAAVEFAVEFTSRAVNAYNEILRMQI